MDRRIKFLDRRLARGENLDLDDARWLLDEYQHLWHALVEVDTYLAHDPDVWRIVSVAKAGDVLCDALGPQTITSINASVEGLLCASCTKELIAEGP